MADRATLEDIKYGGLESAPVDKSYLNPAAGGLSQFGENPLAKIDTQALKKANDVLKNEKKLNQKQYWVRKLFIQYIDHYGKKWSALENYPKQIKQKPAWFDLAFGLFKDSEISAENKKTIKEVFNALWEYRDRSLPERVMGEDEANRQYGTKSPYYIQPEEVLDQVEPTDELYSGDAQAPQMYTEPLISSSIPEQSIRQPEADNDYGIISMKPKNDLSLSRYIVPLRKDATTQANPAMKPPQGGFTIGITQQQKESGGSGSGAFSIGKNMFAGLNTAGSLKGVMNQSKPTLPVQPVQVRPDETITVAQQPQMMQRKKKKSLPSVNRNISDISLEIKKTRSIELPKILNRDMSKPSIKNNSKGIDLSFGKKSFGKNKSMLDLDLGAISLGKKKSGKKVKKQTYGTIKSGKINTSFKVDKGNINTMSRDIKGSVGGVVGGINKLKQQVRGEFKGENIKSLNLKNIKSKKFTDHKDLNVLKKLKSETHSQISREALECKMIPRLREQCDKVFTKNHVANEVSKFRHEFKDIGKMVPTVRGDKAKLTEVAMLGNSITHGVDGAQVADVRAMYKNSGSTKQMSVGRMEYDYSFVTGKKRPKPTMFTDEEEGEY